MGYRRPDLDQPGDGPRRARPGVTPLELDLRLHDAGQQRRPGQRHPGAGARRQPGRLHPGHRPRTAHTIKDGDNDSTHNQVVPEGVADEAKSILETSSPAAPARNADIGAPTSGARRARPRTTATPGSAAATDDVTACVWVGYADTTTPMTTVYNGGPVDGGTFPALIWASVISAWEEIRAERAAESRRRRGRRRATDDSDDSERHRPTPRRHRPVAPAAERPKRRSRAEATRRSPAPEEAAPPDSGRTPPNRRPDAGRTAARSAAAASPPDRPGCET